MDGNTSKTVQGVIHLLSGFLAGLSGTSFLKCVGYQSQGAVTCDIARGTENIQQGKDSKKQCRSCFIRMNDGDNVPRAVRHADEG